MKTAGSSRGFPFFFKHWNQRFFDSKVSVTFHETGYQFRRFAGSYCDKASISFNQGYEQQSRDMCCESKTRG
jgi:hypothetical protein